MARLETLLGGIIFFSFLLGALPVTGSPIAVTLYADRKMTVDHIRLSHIARIVCTDKALARTLKAIPVAKSPQPGQVLTIRKSQVLRKLKENGIDPSVLTVAGAKSVRVRRGTVTVSAKRIRQKVRAVILKRMPWQKDQVRITDKGTLKPVILPEGTLKILLHPVKNEDYIGSIPTKVLFYVGGRLKKRLWVSTHLDLYQKAVVTRKGIGRFQKITEDAVVLKRVLVKGSEKEFINRVEDVLGKRARHHLLPGKMVLQSAIEMPPTLKRGDKVMIIAESNHVKVSVKGVAKEKGYKGDTIRVMNLSSKKMIEAKVLSPEAVQVEF